MYLSDVDKKTYFHISHVLDISNLEGGRAISLMESDRILLCLMKFSLKNETQKLETVIAKTTVTIVSLL